MIQKRKCLICENEIKLFSNIQSQKRKYCSRACMAIGYKSGYRPHTWGKKISKGKMGHGWPENYRETQSRAQKKRFEWDSVWNKGVAIGKARWFWKDRFKEYRNLHTRIQRRFGTPMFCESCQRTDLKKYHWANKSGKYLEERNDWLRLCPKCHSKRDGISKHA